MSDVRVFNEQLLLVLRAGVPLAIGAQQLERDARLARALHSEQDGQRNEQSVAGIRSNELRAALCRETSVFASRQLLRWFPLMVGTFLSGLLVFGYVFCLFWPLTDLLHQLSKP